MEFTQFVRDVTQKISKSVRKSVPSHDLQMNSIDPISLLTAQHREVEDLFDEIQKAGDLAFRTKENLLGIAIMKINLHAKIEERFFYPSAKAIEKELVLEAIEEHRNIRLMISRLTNTNSSDENFDAQVITLKEMFQHHVREEERVLFPRCRAEMAENTLLEIGRKIADYLERGSNRDLSTH